MMATRASKRFMPENSPQPNIVKEPWGGHDAAFESRVQKKGSGIKQAAQRLTLADQAIARDDGDHGKVLTEAALGDKVEWGVS